jgi:large subunit ribosomal protein L23
MKPIYTERSVADAKRGVYTFAFPSRTKKAEIKKAVAEVFDVVVKSVKTINYRPHLRRNLYGKVVRTRGFKKALVALKSGTIDLFEAKTK